MSSNDMSPEETLPKPADDEQARKPGQEPEGATGGKGLEGGVDTGATEPGGATPSGSNPA